MIKNLVKLLALYFGLFVATPAFATLYSYTLSDQSTLTVDTDKGSARLKNSALGTDLTLKGGKLKDFKGEFAVKNKAVRDVNRFNFELITGTYLNKKLYWNYSENTQIPRIFFSINENTKKKEILLIYYKGSKPTYLSPVKWTEDIVYKFGVSEAVPEPENLALLLIGLAGLFISSRKRKSQQNEGGMAGQFQPA